MHAVNPASAALSPLAPDRLEHLKRLISDLPPAHLHWLAGYTAALAQSAPLIAPQAPAAAPVAEPQRQRATVLFGSQTGNGRRLALKLASSLQSAGLDARAVSAAEYAPRDLAKESLLYVLMSTHGDGDPPDEARAFMDFLLSKRAPKLEGLEYAVFALGDSSYPQFCVTGRQVDERLAALGAKRLHERADCDVDIETQAEPWLRAALTSARERAARAGLATVTPLRSAAAPAQHATQAQAQVLAHQIITARGAVRPVYHLELGLPEGTDYEPGDTLAILPTNPPEAVAAVLEAARLDGASKITVEGQASSLEEALTSKLEITRIARPFLVRLAERSGDAVLGSLLAPESRDALRAQMQSRQVADFLAAHRADWSAQDLVAALRPLTRRSYSIASSRKAVGDEAHLTVALVGEPESGNPRWGTASRYLSLLTGDDATVDFHIERNERFRLPADPACDIIMIGPGTGVAPFRGFLQERAAVGASGRNWLVFGSRNIQRDFLYQLEWLAALKNGRLARLDVAFSRDQERKVYVQDRLREAGAELYRWIGDGAHVYVCGDANQMAPDVHAALAGIFIEHGGLSAERATQKLDELLATGRYLRDVY